jgi:hypothetical protein
MTAATSPVIRSGSRSLLKAGFMAAVIAGVINAFVYTVCFAIGVIPWSMLSPGKEVQITPELVVAVSVGGAAAGTLIYAIVRRVTHNPVKVFRWIALGVLIFSFGAPMAMDMFSPMLEVALDLMHVVAAVSTVWALTVWLEDGSRTS